MTNVAFFRHTAFLKSKENGWINLILSTHLSLPKIKIIQQLSYFSHAFRATDLAPIINEGYFL